MDKEKIVFFIDKEEFTTYNDKQTAAQLLKLAKEDPAETTLVLKHGNDLTKFKDDDEVTLKNGMRFVVFHDGPTPVSCFGFRAVRWRVEDPRVQTGADHCIRQKQVCDSSRLRNSAGNI